MKTYLRLKLKIVDVVRCVTGFGENSHAPTFKTLQQTSTEKQRKETEDKCYERK